MMQNAENEKPTRLVSNNNHLYRWIIAWTTRRFFLVVHGNSNTSIQTTLFMQNVAEQIYIYFIILAVNGKCVYINFL